jgi:hypothetical protein
MYRSQAHTFNMARIGNTRERLLEVLDKDRKEIADYQDVRKDGSNEVPSPADRIAKSMALIRAYEARNSR